jgi:thiamine-phosphate pyrophosphorylase
VVGKPVRSAVRAIGGITPLNAAPLIAAGADFIAVCNAVWGSGDPASEVAKFEALFAA